jgi:hypothetical protein
MNVTIPRPPAPSYPTITGFDGEIEIKENESDDLLGVVSPDSWRSLLVSGVRVQEMEGKEGRDR